MRRRKKNRLKLKLVFAFLVISVLFTFFIYELDRIITPTVMAAADAEMRAKAVEIVNNAIIDTYSKQFNYNDIIQTEKDESGNIVMLKADTLKMNKIACDVAIESQNKLKALGTLGMKVPIGYIFKNNLLAYLGPDVSIKMQPIGQIETSYSSEFESAGINQTRHKIYVMVKTKIRVIIPIRNNDIEVKNEVPIAETIIVGKVPQNVLNLDIKDAGFSLRNEPKK